jgi:hypothetical protein
MRLEKGTARGRSWCCRSRASSVGRSCSVAWMGQLRLRSERVPSASDGAGTGLRVMAPISRAVSNPARKQSPPARTSQDPLALVDNRGVNGVNGYRDSGSAPNFRIRSGDSRVLTSPSQASCPTVGIMQRRDHGRNRVPGHQHRPPGGHRRGSAANKAWSMDRG